MVMDPGLGRLSGIMSKVGVTLDEYYTNHANPRGFSSDSVNQTVMGHSHFPPAPAPRYDPASLSTFNYEGDSPEDSEFFSDMALKYINKMLMEEDMDDKVYMYQESAALKAAERSFYEIIGEKYPPSPQRPSFYLDNDVESPEDNFGGRHSNDNSWGSSGHVDNGWTLDAGEYYPSQGTLFVSRDQTTSQSSSSSSNGATNVCDGLDDSPTNIVHVSDFLTENLPIWQFNRGFEEASKFLPNSNKFINDLESNEFQQQELKAEVPVVKLKVENKELKVENKEFKVENQELKVENKEEQGFYPVNSVRGRKNPHPEDVDLENSRSNKHSAVYSEGNERTEIFDLVLLCSKGKTGPAMSTVEEWNKQIVPENGMPRSFQNGQTKGSAGIKSRGKKQGKREVVDLRTLLITCAQAVAADDRRSASELLKQIRLHSSPFGDASQRIAHCFADGLEARMAGTGSQIYNALCLERTTAADILKAYHLYLIACPFKKLSHFFSNQTIMNAAENHSRLHIVDFGIYFGFQWPCLMQRLSNRPGGPPKLRITAIDFPQPGFRPADRVEETGRRLTDYAQSFNIPFEYIPIACKWETIRVEDIKIEEGEVLVVNCLYRFKSLADETVVVDSPRNQVLNTIRKMNPDVFIHGVVNGAFGAPFFITRFREVLFHYSALFDMLETNVAREYPQRIVIEREIFGREALNVIACEGSERVERPETYKQWQVRILRAGFKQLPLNQDIMKKARDKVRSSYHKDFVIDEDGYWMLQGWKGRITFALTTWCPDR
ncbi:scarecrow-like protein 9 [Aristolochia californica]|uniref:scarecrow-like protein 9 n=1 Tax=Aristolochia californica TaxID=171875 RepID=UPI0035D90576